MTNATTAYWFRWALVGAVASAASGAMVAFYQAERAVKKLAGVQSVLRVLVLGIVVIGAWRFGFGGYVLAGVLGACASLAGLLLVMPSQAPGTWYQQLPPGFMKVASLAFAGTLLWTVGRTVDVVLLDRFTLDRAVFGCYALATTMAMVISLVNSATQVVATPFFSSHFTDGRWVLHNAAKWQVVGVIVSVCCAATLYLLVNVLVHFVYGSQYSLTVDIVVPVLLANCLLGSFHILSAALIGINLVKVNTLVAAVVIPLSVLVTFLMVSQYGVWGAAWAQVIAAVTYAAIQSSLGWTLLVRNARCR